MDNKVAGDKDGAIFRTEIIALCLAFLLYIYRPAIPFFKYPFMALYICILVYYFLNFKGQLIHISKRFAINFYLVLLLAAILFVSLLLSNKLYLTIFKDFLNSAILISLFFFSSFTVTKKMHLKKAASPFLIMMILFAFIISIQLLLKLLNVFPGSEVLQQLDFVSDQHIPNDEIDNNFGILPVILGVLALFTFLLKTESSKFSAIYNTLLILFSVSIFFSGSRRGLIIFCAIYALLIFIQILRLVYRNPIFVKLASKTLLYTVSIVAILFLSLLFNKYTSYSFKNATLEKMGSKNILDTKVKIALILLKYNLFIDKTITLPELYNTIWTPVFNPLDPESSWGTRNHRTIFPLTGKNVEMVPADSKGYLLDRTCNASVESSYCDSYSLITEIDAKGGEKIKASVYCYVSEDFDGDAVRLTVRTDYIMDNTVFGNPSAYYDLNEKGVWKKLEIDFECNAGTVQIYISFIKNGVRNFSELKGHVIFAYPDYTKMENRNDSISINTGSHGKSLRISAWLNSQDIYCKKVSIMSLFPFLKKDSQLSLTNLWKDDPLRKWTSILVSEDTVYMEWSNILTVDSTNFKYGEERITRWLFAFQIFSKEFSLRQKLIGGGFSYLNWYGYYFLKDKTKSDWPHNPYLSILLYSGILGLLIYCYFIYKVFNYYMKYLRIYPILFIFFLITSFFAFFSGGSPFDPPIMGFFAVLPIFIHTVHKNDLSDKD